MTDIYVAKRALFDRLAFEQTLPNGRFTKATLGFDVGISYDSPPDQGLACIYGGGVRFVHNDLVPEKVGAQVYEDGSMSVYVRVSSRPKIAVADADAKAAQVGRQLLQVIFENPDLGQYHTITGIGRGQGAYISTDDETMSVLSYEVRVLTRFSYWANA